MKSYGTALSLRSSRSVRVPLNSIVRAARLPLSTSRTAKRTCVTLPAMMPSRPGACASPSARARTMTSARVTSSCADGKGPTTLHGHDGAAHERAPTTVSSRRMDIPITGVPNALAATYARAGNREEALKIGRQAREQAAARGQTNCSAASTEICRLWKWKPPVDLIHRCDICGRPAHFSSLPEQVLGR